MTVNVILTGARPDAVERHEQTANRIANGRREMHQIVTIRGRQGLAAPVLGGIAEGRYEQKMTPDIGRTNVVIDIPGSGEL